MHGLVYLIISVLSLQLNTSSAQYTQCNNKGFLNKCASSLGKYNFAKAYKINRKMMKRSEASNKIEYSYVMKKGTNYKLAICNGQSSNKMIVKLYNRDHEVIATSYNKEKDKHYSAIAFRCKSTGPYYITYSFQKEGDACGLCILGFK